MKEIRKTFVVEGSRMHFQSRGGIRIPPQKDYGMKDSGNQRE